MKPILDWMKANVPIVVLSALIVLILPAAFIGSSFWNKRIQRKREADANLAMNNLAAVKISYNHPSVFANGTPVTTALDAPNATVSKYYRENRQKLDEQVAQVAGVAKRINQNSHRLLVEGVFVMPPAPPATPEAPGAPTPTGAPAGAPPAPGTPGAAPPGAIGVDPLKALELEDLIIGRPDKPSVYQKLLDDINAGPPADPVRIAETVDDIQRQFNDSVRAQSNRTTLSEAEQKDLTAKLVQARIGHYQQHAQEISVYAARECLPKDILQKAPSETPDPVTVYQWNYDYWVISDLLHAVDAANTVNGQRSTVDKSVVKRIEFIKLDPITGTTEASITGRKSAPDNKLYDVRDASLQVVVSSARLPELINAISRTNFMTVVGLSFKDVDPWADLDMGYYYGPQHVVRANLKVETVWLRSWTEPLMPQAVRDLLNPPVAAEAAAPPPPPPPKIKAPQDDFAAPKLKPGSQRPPPTKRRSLRDPGGG